jgi:hypothetical protein
MRQCQIADPTRLRRHPERGAHDADTVYAILDALPLCHIAWNDGGHPRQLMTAHWREGDTLYIHGGRGSSALKALSEGAEACVAVASFDGLVLARSAFSTSVNYRSALLFGHFHSVEEPVAKMARLEAFFERLLPGRWAEIRPPTPQELAATYVLGLPLTQAVAKVRSGPPQDDAGEDPSIWAGVRPLQALWGEPIADPESLNLALPPSLAAGAVVAS